MTGLATRASRVVLVVTANAGAGGGVVAPEGAVTPEGATTGGGARRRRELFESAVQAIAQSHEPGELTLDQLAATLFTSRRQLQRAFGEAGTSVRAVRHAVAMDRAARLLAESSLSVAEIAREAGYRYPAQFAKAFRRRHGRSPSGWRKDAAVCPAAGPSGSADHVQSVRSSTGVPAVHVRAPASSANLGPGFDVLAAALGLHMELEVEEAGRFEVRTELPIARDRRNAAVRGFATLRSPDRVRFTIRSQIPLSCGLGTSAAAYAAGLAAADALNGGGADLLGKAAWLEGQPANVAAALLGGFVICTGTGAERLEPPSGLSAVLVVPERAVRAATARAALPRKVPMADAVFNVSRASLLVLGLARADLKLVARGLEDRLHQPLRASLYPRSMDLARRAHELGALGATISGAGPTVLLWVRSEAAREVEARVEREAEGWAQVLRVPFAAEGVQLS